MKKHLFHISVNFAAGVSFEDVVELPANLTDEEVEEEFKEWVWERIEGYRHEL